MSETIIDLPETKSVINQDKTDKSEINNDKLDLNENKSEINDKKQRKRRTDKGKHHIFRKKIESQTIVQTEKQPAVQNDNRENKIVLLKNNGALFLIAILVIGALLFVYFSSTKTKMRGIFND